MKYFSLGAIMFLLAGCSVLSQPTPIKPKFPDPVPELMKKCEELHIVNGNNVLITDLLKTIVQNYALYHECANKVEGWQNWYNAQKQIYGN